MSHALRHRRLAGGHLLVALAAVSLVACGDDDADVASTPTTAVTEETSTSTAPSTTSASDSRASGDYGGAATSTEDMTADSGGSPAVELADSGLGRILVADGRTLYAFTPDTEGVSTCYEECASAWPPLLATGEVKAGTDLDAELFATSPRTDGQKQVTVDGHPLYYFASDAAPGDTNGQGVGDKWYVVGADGALITG